MSFSPSSISRIGSPSATSSDDLAAGIQYCRMKLPITVPGPTRVRSSLSCLAFMGVLSVFVFVVVVSADQDASGT